MARLYDDVLPEYLHLPVSGPCGMKGLDLTLEEKAHRAKWSGAAKPPAIGDAVTVKKNSIGAARVVQYFVDNGHLGLRVECASPPAWMHEQNGHNFCHVYGAEIE